MQEIPADLFEAVRVLVHQEHIEDRVYDVRERELKGWNGPRVLAYSNACAVLRKYAGPEPADA